MSMPRTYNNNNNNNNNDTNDGHSHSSIINDDSKTNMSSNNINNEQSIQLINFNNSGSNINTTTSTNTNNNINLNTSRSSTLYRSNSGTSFGNNNNNNNNSARNIHTMQANYLTSDDNTNNNKSLRKMLPISTAAVSTTTNTTTASKQRSEFRMIYGDPDSHYSIWPLMIRYPWPFVCFVPILYIILISVGYTIDFTINSTTGSTTSNNIATSFSTLFVPTKSINNQYLQTILVSNGIDNNGNGRMLSKHEYPTSTTNFYAMSLLSKNEIHVNANNIIDPIYLPIIHQRMIDTEQVTVTYKNDVYTWDDICAMTTNPYQVPCGRLSVLDLFQEASTNYYDNKNNNGTSTTSTGQQTPPETITTTTTTTKNINTTTNKKVFWYKSIVQKQILRSRINRFGILLSSCAKNEECIELTEYRTADPISTGYSPINLLIDITNLEYSNKCRICIEQNYNTTIVDLQKLIVKSLSLLSTELVQYVNGTTTTSTPNDPNILIATDIVSKLAIVQNKSLSWDTIEDFYYYYVIRQLYGRLGYPNYMKQYNELIPQLNQLVSCSVASTGASTSTNISTSTSTSPVNGIQYCPISTIDKTIAFRTLLRHADNTISISSFAGSPFPLWGQQQQQQPPQSGTTGSSTTTVQLLLMGNFPISGSGINMSSNLKSISDYLDLANHPSQQQQENTASSTLGTSIDNVDVNSTSTLAPTSAPTNGNTATTIQWKPNYNTITGYINISSTQWKDMVLSNPFYAWLMSDLEPVEHECNDYNLSGTRTGVVTIDDQTATIAHSLSDSWCDQYALQNKDDGNNSSNYTRQYYGRMWYDALINSEPFLNLHPGIDHPYNWTLGTGCGYKLGGQRTTFTNQSKYSTLYNASRDIYLYDEGMVYGAIDRQLLIGDSDPKVGSYSFDNPLTRVGVIQTQYPALTARYIIDRVLNCNRPSGSITISIDDANEILRRFKEAMENVWTKGWDDPDESVQFVGYFDDTSVPGTTGRLFKAMTLANQDAILIAMIILFVLSALVSFQLNMVQSRVLVSSLGFALVVLGYFAGIGLSKISGITSNFAISWTLPFVVFGYGVSDLYFILAALRKQDGNSDRDFLQAMRDVLIPITATSAINVLLFGTLNISDIPVVYMTARAGMCCVSLIYVILVLCFPAFCLIDLRRQNEDRYDLLICCKRSASTEKPIAPKENSASAIVSHYLYERTVLSSKLPIRTTTHSLVVGLATILVAIGGLGLSRRFVGLHFHNLFPINNQAALWTSKHTDLIPSWNIYINWGRNDIAKPNVQLEMIKQFEDVVANNKISDVETKRLWIAEFALWASKLCEDNLGRDNFEVSRCGRDQVFNFTTTCSATWSHNNYSLREAKIFQYDSDTCQTSKGGICRKLNDLDLEDKLIVQQKYLNHSADVSYCPVIEGWLPEKWEYCLRQWRYLTNTSNGGLLVKKETRTETECTGVYNKDENVVWPISYSTGPPLVAFDLYSHSATMDLLQETREVCDQKQGVQCWMEGIPFSYWSQFENTIETLGKISGFGLSSVFATSFALLYFKFSFDRLHERPKILCGIMIASLLVTILSGLSFTSVMGLSILSGVPVTDVTIASFLFSVAFSVKYSIHIVAAWLRVDLSEDLPLCRVKTTMSFLLLPLFMTLLSSVIGVACIAYSSFRYIQLYFFRPLIISVVVAYFFSCWLLPVLLCYLNFSVVKLGKAVPKRNFATTISSGRQIKAIRHEVSTVPQSNGLLEPPIEDLYNTDNQNFGKETGSDHDLDRDPFNNDYDDDVDFVLQNRRLQ